MGRRPKLIVGDLYHIRSYNEWDEHGYHNEEYIVQALKVEKEVSLLVDVTAIIFKTLIIASTQQDISSSDLRYDPVTKSYPWNHRWVIEIPFIGVPRERIVIQKFNPKKLPLYLNWGYGADTIRDMLKGTYDKPERALTPEPAPTH